MRTPQTTLQCKPIAINCSHSWKNPCNLPVMWEDLLLTELKVAAPAMPSRLKNDQERPQLWAEGRQKEETGLGELQQRADPHKQSHQQPDACFSESPFRISSSASVRQTSSESLAFQCGEVILNMLSQLWYLISGGLLGPAQHPHASAMLFFASSFALAESMISRANYWLLHWQMTAPNVGCM